MSASTSAPAELQAAAARLREAERTRTPIPPVVEQHPLMTVDDAYAVQALNVEARIGAGARLVGHKIGLTSEPMQKMLGVDQPDYGALLDDQVHESGAAVDAAAFIAPRIEPELAFLLARDLSGVEITAADVLDATAYIVPALEVIDSRIADWKIGLIDTIADNASCGCAVVGTTRTTPADVAMASALVELRVDGESGDTGAGAAVLGHPAKAVAWLAGALAAQGVTLRAGQVVLSGSITAAIPLTPGTTVVADFGELGSAEVHVR